MLTLEDIGIIKQLPIVAIFLIVVFRIQKENREAMAKRDEEFTRALGLLTTSVRLMSDRVYGLGLAFVALAGENDTHKGADAARKIMQDVANEGVAREKREAGAGWVGNPGYGMGD